MTLVSLLIRIDIYKSLAIFLFRGCYDFGRGFGHGVSANDGQARLGQQLLAQLFVGALHADDQRYAEIDGLARGNYAFGDNVATHDAAEDVDQYGFDTLVLEHDLEGFGDFFRRGAAADIKEVGRLAAKQLDGVHGCHGQARTIDQAANIAVELNVCQVELAGFYFSGILFVQVTVGDDIGVTIQRVGIEIELRIKRDDVALAVAIQGVDFYQRGIGFHVADIELLAHVDELGCGIGRHAYALGERFAVGLGKALERVDHHGDDFFGRGVGDLFDVHAAFAGSDEGHLLRGAIS